MNLIEVGEGKKEGGEEEEEGTGDRGCKLRKSGEAVSLSLSLSPLDHVVSRIRWPSFFFFFHTRLFSICRYDTFNPSGYRVRANYVH